jgi:hypothetical protein
MSALPLALTHTPLYTSHGPHCTCWRCAQIEAADVLGSDVCITVNITGLSSRGMRFGLSLNYSMLDETSMDWSDHGSTARITNTDAWGKGMLLLGLAGDSAQTDAFTALRSAGTCCTQLLP